MPLDRLEMNGPAAAAFGLLLLAVAAHAAGDAIVRVVEAVRRGRQRERELAALEAYHALAFPRPPAADRPDRHTE